MLWVLALMAVGIYVLCTLLAGDIRQRVLSSKIGFVRDRHETITTLTEIIQDVLTPDPVPRGPEEPSQEQIRAQMVAELEAESEQAVPKILTEIEDHARQDPIAFGRAIRHLMRGVEPAGGRACLMAAQAEAAAAEAEEALVGAEPEA